jgi:nucleoside-diphosphate-sugar epimerase
LIAVLIRTLNSFRAIFFDFDLVKGLLPEFDIVIPLAAIVGAPACKRNPALTRLVNYDAHMNIVKNVSADQKVLLPTTQQWLWDWRKG